MYDRDANLLGTDAQKPRSTSQTLKRFWHYFRLYKWALIGVLLLMVVGTYLQVLIPDLTGQAVDCYLVPASSSSSTVDTTTYSNCWYTTPNPEATPAENIAGLGGLVLIIVVLYISSSLGSGVLFYLMSWAGFHVLRDMRRDIFAQINRLSLSYFSKHEVGDVMSRITNDIDTIQQVIGFGIVSVLQGSLLVVWIVITMVGKSPVYALISLSTLPLMFFVTRWFSAQARKAFRRARLEIGAVNADLQENIAAVREVQAFSREDESIEQFRLSNAANRDANISAQVYTSALAPALEALAYVSLAIVAGVGGYVILTGGTLFGATISLGLVVTFIGYTQHFNRPVQQISVLWANIQSAIAGGERIFDLIDEAPDLSDKPGAAPIPPIRGDVVFTNVWAEYNPGEPVLRGVSLHATPGQTVAIVGPTGAGKTTIINLIPRFYDVTRGSVTIDGYDVRDVTRQSLRQQIGLVLQDTFLFSDTIFNNIRYARPDASEAEVMAAAKLARAHEFITNLTDGYNTVLGERGSGLSQGQRQLLAIARVALIDPRILILDEATSSVDTRTEREIQKALDRLLAGRTSFVIAHRLSTIRNAHQVIVLDQGQIVERGTHESLLAQRGFYYNLYMSQFRRQLEAEEDAAVPAELVMGD
ncbi:MAG: ABC transporter ATP-binding protein [Candidatus Promineifilaceae bacterium]